MLNNKNHFDKQLSDYKSWVKKIRVFSNVAIYVFIVIGAVLFYYGYHNDSWLKWAGFFIGLYSFIELAKREGHKEGYFDGLSQGIYESENEGFDDEMKAFKSEIEINNQLYEDIKKSKK